MSDSADDLFLTQNNFSGSLNVSSKLDEELATEQPRGAYDNAQLSVAEVTEVLFEDAKQCQDIAAVSRIQ